MKYYPENSTAIEYVEIPETVEKNGPTLIIQPKNHRNFIELKCTIQAAKKEEIPTMKITMMPNNLQIHLTLFENSHYLTLFRWMVDYKLITTEFASDLYKEQSKKLALQYHQSKSPFTEKSDISENIHNIKESNAPQPNAKS